MKLWNVCTAILFCVGCLATYNSSAHAQTFEIRLDGLPTSDNTGDAFEATGVEAVPRFDMISDMPVTVGVTEDPSETLELTLLNATSNNSTQETHVNVSGLGFGIDSTALLDDQGNVSVAESGFRLDGAYEEFLTFSFNQDVNISTIVVTNLDDHETFSFGSFEFSATDPNFTAGDNSNAESTFSFGPDGLLVTAGEEIVVGNTVFDLALLTTGNAGVGFESITLEVVGGPPAPPPAIPEPSSLAVVCLGGMLTAVRRRRS